MHSVVELQHRHNMLQIKFTNVLHNYNISTCYRHCDNHKKYIRHFTYLNLDKSIPKPEERLCGLQVVRVQDGRTYEHIYYPKALKG